MTDSPSLREHLAREIGTCLASDLPPHLQRGAVVIVEDALDLLDVAVAIAEDRVELVRGWIESKRLTRPTLQRIENWKTHPHDAFRLAIVQPYVLIQPLVET